MAIEGLDELWKSSGAETQIEEVQKRVEDMFALAQATARRTFSTHRLLIHWVTSAGTLQVSEDELRAEIRAAGEDAVQQLLDELREPEGAPGSSQAGSRGYCIGERYRVLMGNERAIVSQLRDDAQGLKAPRHYRIKLTVDDRAAERLARIGSSRLEPALRDAVEKTFRGAFRQAQSAFVIHENERGTRRFGNSHAHVILSPLLADRKTSFVSKRRLEIFKHRWEREVGRVLEFADGAASLLKPRSSKSLKILIARPSSCVAYSLRPDLGRSWRTT